MPADQADREPSTEPLAAGEAESRHESRRTGPALTKYVILIAVLPANGAYAAEHLRSLAAPKPSSRTSQLLPGRSRCGLSRRLSGHPGTSREGLVGNGWPERGEHHGAMPIMTRRGTDGDARAVADLWLRARRAAVGTIPPPVHDNDDVGAWFASHVVRDAELWLAVGRAGTVVGVLVLEGTWID